jgi:hypothetical protein
MGKHRNSEIYPGLHRHPKRNRDYLQLVGVCNNEECRLISVRLDIFIALRVLIRHQKLRYAIQRSDGSAGCGSGGVHANRS